MLIDIEAFFFYSWNDAHANQSVNDLIKDDGDQSAIYDGKDRCDELNE